MKEERTPSEKSVDGSLAPPDLSKLIKTEFFKDESFANLL
jgi:hypothetical protein